MPTLPFLVGSRIRSTTQQLLSCVPVLERCSPGRELLLKDNPPVKTGTGHAWIYKKMFIAVTSTRSCQGAHCWARQPVDGLNASLKSQTACCWLHPLSNRLSHWLEPNQEIGYSIGHSTFPSSISWMRKSAIHTPPKQDLPWPLIFLKTLGII